MTGPRVIACDADIDAGLAALLAVDPGFHCVISRAGTVPLRDGKPGFTGLASIIVSQMVSKAAADAVWNRLEALVGTGVEPHAVLAHSSERLRACGLSGAKERTIRHIAELVVSDQIDLEAIARAEARHAIKELTAIKGVGPWTAEVYLLFCAGHPDVFPVGDVALQNAAAHAYGLAERPSGKAFATMAERWQPWRSMAARALWAYYATEMKRDGTPVA